MSYKIKIPIFEGPFDLLVYLIENSNVSIYDVNIADITNQYTAYLSMMKTLDVSLASEFMVLAATLLDIKAKSLLPKKKNEEGDELEADPRKMLIRRIEEYKEFKRISKVFANMEEEGLKVFEKPQEDLTEYLENPDEILKMDSGSFHKAFMRFLQKKKKIVSVKRNYVSRRRKTESVQERITYIYRQLENLKEGEMELLSNLSPEKETGEIVLTFISILQMVRDGRARCSQKRLFGDIMVGGV